MAFDILRAKYYPETIIDAFRMDIETTSTEVVRYATFDPYCIYLKSAAIDSAKDVTLEVEVDGSTDISTYSAASGGLDVPMEFDQLAQTSMVVSATSNTGAQETNVPFRLTFAVDKLSVYDKIFRGDFVSKRLRETAKTYGIQAQALAGIQSKIASNRWLYKREVSKTFSGLSADQNPTVGTIVDAPYIKDIDDNIVETKVVMLGVSLDRSLATGDCYVSITRGENEEDYIQVDCRTMIGLSYWEDIFIPARDRLDIIYQNGSVTDGKIKFRYGVAPLNIRDKIKWGVQLNDFEEDAITSLKASDAIDVYEMISVGLL